METLNTTAIRNKVQEICEMHNVKLQNVNFNNGSTFDIILIKGHLEIRFLNHLSLEFKDELLYFNNTDEGIEITIMCFNNKYRL